MAETATQTSTIDPTLAPYLTAGLDRATTLFLTGPQPTYYPGQTYVSPSQQTLDALQMQEDIARRSSGMLQAGQQAYQQALGNIGQTASGAFLQGSPYQQAAINTAVRPIQQQFTETTLPGLQSAFSRAGRYGSGAQSRAIGQAQESASRAMGDVASNIAYGDYARERQMQQQAQTQQAALAGMAPQFYASQFLPSQTLGQVGAAREAIAAQPLQEDIARYTFAQQQPVQSLMSYLSSVYGTPMGNYGTTTTSYPSPQTNYFGNVLGGAILGGQVGQMFGNQQLGAILGGGAGLLF